MSLCLTAILAKYSKQGGTPLHYSTSVLMTELLTNAGADPTMRIKQR